MEEIWKSVPGWEDRYEVSNLGRVRSLCHRGKPRWRPWLVKQGANGKGYCQVKLCRDSLVSSRQVHRLVAEAFLGACPDGRECAHLDGNPQNNQVSNLAWVTPKENMQHRDAHERTSWGESRPLSVFTVGEVVLMRLRHANGERRADIVRDIVSKKNCDPTVVRDILGFRTWKRVT